MIKARYAIDLGTSNSSVAITYKIDKQKITQVFEVEKTRKFYPSLLSSNVYVADETDDIRFVQNLRVGVAQRIGEPHRILSNIKMDMIKNSAKAKRLPSLEKTIEYKYAIAAILKHLKRVVDEEIRGTDIKVYGAIVSVPVGVSDLYKSTILSSLVIAGFYSSIEEAQNDAEFIAEPTAVAIYYSHALSTNKNVLVFDFGGGTLDVSVFNLKDSARLGGERGDLEQLDVISSAREDVGGKILTKYFFINSFCKKYTVPTILKCLDSPTTSMNPWDLWDKMVSGHFGLSGLNLVDAIDNLKCCLSDAIAAPFTYSKLEAKTFMRAEFEQAIKTPFFDEQEAPWDLILKTVKRALDQGRNGRLNPKTDISEVYTAGGSSLIPCVVRYLRDTFSRYVNDNVGASETMEAIVRGASEFACKDTVVQSITTSEYGYENKQRIFIPIIQKNTPISETAFDGKLKKGISGMFRRPMGCSTLVIKIQQKTQNGINQLGELKIEPGIDRFELFMSIDEQQERLQIRIYDRDTNTDLVERGLISKRQTIFSLKNI